MALFKKSDYLVGLDIGSGAIKVAEIQESRGSRALVRFGMIPMPVGAMEEGMIKDPEQVAETIQELCTSADIQEPNAAISIAGYSVIVKNITVGKMSEEEMQENLHVEAEQFLPFDVQDVYLDFHILGDNPEKEGQMNVVLVAAKKDLIDEYVSVVELAGLNPCIMDVDAFALQNIFELNYGEVDQIVALVDVGATKTNVNIIKDNKSVLIRDVSMGGWQITSEIMSQGGCSAEEAEQWKLDPKSSKMDPEELSDIIAMASSRWCEEIRPAIDFFYSINEERPDKIVLSGGGSLVKGFKELLSRETGIPVEIMEPFSALEINDSQFDTSYLERIAPQAAICLGLALRKVGDK
ncbi:MAG: type IV pilus assembly protein PilM [Deltaproteobacteria bacterium]|nr:type IV pilus assembly protein PilM [Deltaproteobacteria bacterium]